MLVVSHDIDFVRAVATSVLEITREGVRRYPGGYDYYREKKDAEASARETPQKREVATAAAAAPAARLSPKEERKRRAEERARIAPAVKELRRRIETAERKTEELQKALDEASAELFNPTPQTDFAEANRKVRTLQFEIDRYTADWEEATEALEKLAATT